MLTEKVHRLIQKLQLGDIAASVTSVHKKTHSVMCLVKLLSSQLDSILISSTQKVYSNKCVSCQNHEYCRISCRTKYDLSVYVWKIVDRIF